MLAWLDQFYAAFVPVFLVTVMASMGLALTFDDLRKVFSRPKGLIAGLSAQIFLLPLIGIGLGLLYQSPPVIAAGAIILCACPGGVSSNAYTFSAKADIALSIGLTVVASLVTIFTIPWLTFLALNMHLGEAATPTLSAIDMAVRLAQFTLAPLAVGLLVRAIWPAIALRIVEFARVLALVSLIVIAVVGTIVSWDQIVANIWQAGLLMASINLVSMALGYQIGNALKLPFPQKATITFEVGVQNLSMALFVALTFLENPDLAIAAITYAFIMKVTALSFVWYVRNRLSPSTTAADAPKTGTSATG